MMEKAKKIFEQENYISFTSDLDWAPEIAIEETLNLLIQNKIRPTIFVTHRSRVIDKYKDNIDLGIHPNFIQPSSQGNSIKEIVDYCINLVPETKVFRAHRWFSSNDIYDYLLTKGFAYESNLCTHMEVLPPFIQRSGMVSFPVFFEDGAYISHSSNIKFDLVKNKFMQNGLKVINIHPMHYALNTPYFKYTRNIKDQLTREEWNMMDKTMLKNLRYDGLGISDFIEDLISFVKTNGLKVITLEQAYEMYMQN